MTCRAAENRHTKTCDWSKATSRCRVLRVGTSEPTDITRFGQNSTKTSTGGQSALQPSLLPDCPNSSPFFAPPPPVIFMSQRHGERGRSDQGHPRVQGRSCAGLARRETHCFDWLRAVGLRRRRAGKSRACVDTYRNSIVLPGFTSLGEKGLRHSGGTYSRVANSMCILTANTPFLYSESWCGANSVSTANPFRFSHFESRCLFSDRSPRSPEGHRERSYLSSSTMNARTTPPPFSTRTYVCVYAIHTASTNTSQRFPARYLCRYK